MTVPISSRGVASAVPSGAVSYGCWASPISAETLAEGSIGVSDLRAVEGRLYWIETRPEEHGRQVLITGGADGWRQMSPDGLNVRTRVHEYGGAPYLAHAERLYLSNFADQRLYAQDAGGLPLAVTPEGYRYADCVAAPGGGLIGVREDHTDPARVCNAVVALSGQAGDAGHILFAGSDFVAYPRVSRDGRRLAWMVWDHPNMPWDDTRLLVGDLSAEGLTQVRAIAGGGGGEAVMEPQWAEDGSLYFISDRTGFWNLYVFRSGEVRPVLPMDAEFGRPLWRLGQSNYALLSDGRIVAAFADTEGHHLAVIEPSLGVVKIVPLPFTVFGDVQAMAGNTVALTAASAVQPLAVVMVDVETGDVTEVRRPSASTIDGRHISKAEPITFPGAGGGDIHALYYPPVNGDFTAPEGEAPPSIIQIHGGPTNQASPAFNLATQFWTSRGFAVVDVDHRGSSGYGRAYRQRLNGQWGVVDVEDVIAAVRHLVDLGRIDPDRVAIHGGSAGGYTVLGALTRSDVFKAGASFYGVADLEALARDTHKFESRYLDNLVGPYPAAQAIYHARSPINHLDGLTAPLIIFQGADDLVVPPNQAHAIRDALRLRGRPVAYVEFAGETHGFRRAENIIASKQAELYFYGRIFDFRPADALPEVLVENLPPPA